MKALAKQLADERQSGVYSLTRDAGDIETAGREAGLNVFRIDIGGAKDKRDFLARIAQALKFPQHFGHNWDALNDSLTDLEWLPGKKGYILILENATRYGSKQKDELKSAVSVFESAAEYWKAEGRPFWAFIHGVENLDLPRPT